MANDLLWDGGTQFGLSATLPSTQWQKEVSNFFNVSLAALQRAGPAFAQPPAFDVGNPIADRDNNILKFIKKPEDSEMLRLCDAIKMRSKAHTSFSVLGLFLLIGLGLLIMLLNMVLPWLVASWQLRSGEGGYKRLEWVESNAFQLQRMAAEGRGVGPWRGKEADVPTLVAGSGAFNLTGMSLRSKGGEGVMQSNTGYQGHRGYQSVGGGEDMEIGVMREEVIVEGDEKKAMKS